MNIRRSKILAKIRSGEVANCIKLNLSDPRVVEIVGLLGFDSVWLCMEHVPNSISVIENMIRAAKMHDIDSIVRIRKGCYSDYIYPLELDAAGIMVPHLMSLEEAKELTKITRFYPLGMRPWDGGNADGAFCMMPADEYMKQSNREKLVIAQIEDPQPLDELEAIAQVEGIDMLFFGPGDFSQAIGKPAQWNAPEISDTRKRIAEVCQKYGKFAGTVGSLDSYEKLKNMGYQFMHFSADVRALTKEFSTIAKQLGITKDSKDPKGIY